MSTPRETPPDLAHMLEGFDWSRCSGRDLHRLAEGAAQVAASRRQVVGLEGLRKLREINLLSVKLA